MFYMYHEYFLHAHSSMSVDGLAVAGLAYSIYSAKTKHICIIMYITMLSSLRVVTIEL